MSEPPKLWHPSPTHPVALQRARELRQERTRAEKLLWQALRTRPSGFKVRRQHPVGKYILDFYVAEHKLAIELDGSVHDTAEQREADAWREGVIATHGITFLRFRNQQVFEDTAAVVRAIVERCQLLKT